MNEILYYLGWEIINVSLEYTAVAWAKLPRKMLAVIGVNLLTHPLFVWLMSVFGRGAGFLALAESIIFLVEWLALVVIYGRRRWRYVGLVAFTMNVVSLATGLMIS